MFVSIHKTTCRHSSEDKNPVNQFSLGCFANQFPTGNIKGT